jgi:hypothetical protein
VDYWKKRGIEIFKTSGLAFVRALRARLTKDDLVPSEQFLEFLHRERRRITGVHLRLNQMSHGGFTSAMYQDGVLHALGDLLTAMGLGTKKKESFERDLFEAENSLKKMWHKRDPVEIAYWTGRKEATESFCSRKIKRIRTYIHPYSLKPATRFVKGKAE